MILAKFANFAFANKLKDTVPKIYIRIQMRTRTLPSKTSLQMCMSLNTLLKIILIRYLSCNLFEYVQALISFQDA